MSEFQNLKFSENLIKNIQIFSNGLLSSCLKILNPERTDENKVSTK